jgi:hypothetical protein
MRTGSPLRYSGHLSDLQRPSHVWHLQRQQRDNQVWNESLLLTLWVVRSKLSACHQVTPLTQKYSMLSCRLKTDENHCGNPDPNGLAPCQDGFGLCEIVPPPPCGKAGSTNGRKIGYYQASNTRDRVCNKVSPSQINTTGYSHLYYAFAAVCPCAPRRLEAQARRSNADQIILVRSKLLPSRPC